MLDDHIIQGLKAADKPKKYADGGGLFLFIPASGKKLWRLAYRFERKAKLLSFGEYPQVSLRAARQRRDAQPAGVRHSVRHSAQLTFAGIRPLQQKSRYIIPVFVLCNADSVIGCFSSMSGYLSGHFTYNAPLNEKTHKRSV